MYVCVTCDSNVKAGDILFLERSSDFGEVAAKVVGGIIVGFVTDMQPDGCVSKQYIESRIGGGRIVGRVAITGGNVALFTSENVAFGTRSSLAV